MPITPSAPPAVPALAMRPPNAEGRQRGSPGFEISPVSSTQLERKRRGWQTDVTDRGDTPMRLLHEFCSAVKDGYLSGELRPGFR